MQEWYRSRGLYEAVMKLLASGKVSEAVRMADGIPDKTIRSKAFSQIAISAAKKGEEYRELLEKAVEAAMDIDNPKDSTKALMSLAFELLHMGKTDDALEVAGYIRDLSNRAKVEAEVAMQLAKEGDVARAMEIINGITDEDVKTWAMSMLASRI